MLTCRDRCNAGAKQCVAAGATAECQQLVSGCYDWVVAESCGSTNVCSAGDCTPSSSCVAQCAAGSSRCTAQGQVQLCVSLGNGCSDWAFPTNCNSGFECLAGACIASAPDPFDAGTFDAGTFDAGRGLTAWSSQFETSIAQRAVGVAVDQSGDVIVAGDVVGAMAGQRRLGMRDGFVRKYTSSGAVLWTSQFGTSRDDSVQGVVVDASANVLVVSNSEESGPPLYQRPAFVRKYSPSGALLWNRPIVTMTSGQTVANDLAVNAADESVIAGYTTGQLPGEVALGAEDAFVCKLDRLGNIVWARQFGASTYDRAWGVAFDQAGNVLVSGSTRDAPPNTCFLRKYDGAGNVLWTRQGGGGCSEGRIAANSIGEFFLAVGPQVVKYDSAGNGLWSHTMTSTGAIGLTGLRVDGAGNVVLLANNDGQLTPGVYREGFHVFVVRKLSSSGVALWTREFSSDNQVSSGVTDRGWGLALEATGTILVAGETTRYESVENGGLETDALVVRLPP